MKQHFRARRVAAIFALGLLASACGSGGGTSPTVPLDGADDAADDAAGDSPDAAAGGGGPGGGITAIDATRGNGAVLPADNDGPSAYDLARARDRRGGAASDAVEWDAPPADGADIAANATDLPKPANPVTIAPPGPPTPAPTPPQP